MKSRKLWRSARSTAAASAPSGRKASLARSCGVGVIQGPEALFSTIASNRLRFSGAIIARSSLTTGTKAPLASPMATRPASPYGMQ